MNVNSSSGGAAFTEMPYWGVHCCAEKFLNITKTQCFMARLICGVVDHLLCSVVVTSVWCRWFLSLLFQTVARLRLKLLPSNEFKFCSVYCLFLLFLFCMFFQCTYILSASLVFFCSLSPRGRSEPDGGGVLMTPSLSSGGWWESQRANADLCAWVFCVRPCWVICHLQRALRNPNRPDCFLQHPPGWTWCCCPLYRCDLWKPPLPVFWSRCRPRT